MAALELLGYVQAEVALDDRSQPILPEIPLWRTGAKELAREHRVKEAAGPPQACRRHEPHLKQAVVDEPLTFLDKERRPLLHEDGRQIHHDHPVGRCQLEEAQPIGERV
jgi:hypothetical protein